MFVIIFNGFDENKRIIKIFYLIDDIIWFYEFFDWIILDFFNWK